MRISILAILFCFSSLVLGQESDDARSPLERGTLVSQHLKEERSYQVYLPPNYHTTDKGNFPVIYLIDGDYNFHYNTGIVEVLSSVSGKIPEMIVVAISDKGNEHYKIDCTPTTEKGGNADNFMSYIQEELKPLIKQKYRASAYDILIGHSLGGLFTTNYFLERPEDFDTYIAIDPSYWWQDYEIIERADGIFSKTPELKSQLYISLADTKGMGVRQFAAKLDKYYPDETSWKYFYYPEENHGSVGITTLSDALKDLFKDWEVTREQFYSFRGAQDVVDNYLNHSKSFKTQFGLPSAALGNFMNYYQRKELVNDLKILEEGIRTHFPASIDDFYKLQASYLLENGKSAEAKTLLEKRLKEAPDSVMAHDGLAKWYYTKEHYKQAKEYSSKAFALARKQHLRQWQLNELQSNDTKIVQKL